MNPGAAGIEEKTAQSKGELGVVINRRVQVAAHDFHRAAALLYQRDAGLLYLSAGLDIDGVPVLSEL